MDGELLSHVHPKCTPNGATGGCGVMEDDGVAVIDCVGVNKTKEHKTDKPDTSREGAHL